MKINKLCKFAPKSNIKAGEAALNGNYMFFTSSSDENKRYKNFQIDSEAIIMGTGGNATLHYYNGKFATSTDCVVLLINTPVIRCKYLYYYLLAHINILEQGFKGAGLKHTNKNYIGNIEINNIPSIEIQDKIIKKIDNILSLIDIKKKELNLLDELIKARFIELFGSVEDNRFGIKTVKIKDACELINGKAFKPEDWSDKGLPIVRIQNLNNEQAPFNYFEGEIKEQYLIDTGELLFSWSGTPGTSFGAFFWNRGKAVLNQHIFRVKPKLKFNLFFLQFALNGRIDFIISKAHGGVGLQHITKKELDEVELLLPSVEQQNQFAAFVKQTDKSKSVCLEKIEKYTELYNKLMNDYFGG